MENTGKEENVRYCPIAKEWKTECLYGFCGWWDETAENCSISTISGWLGDIWIFIDDMTKKKGCSNRTRFYELMK